MRSEAIKNNYTKSELDLIYRQDSVILQMKRKNKPVETYYGFDSKAAKRIKLAWEWKAEAELIEIASASENSLSIIGCDLKTWEIPFSFLPCLDGKSFGKAISAVRKAHKLNKDGIDGISDRHLRRFENGGQQPSLDALKKLAASHGLDLEDYFTQVNQSLFKIKS